jgi:hypothetical protein
VLKRRKENIQNAKSFAKSAKNQNNNLKRKFCYPKKFANILLIVLFSISLRVNIPVNIDQ